MSIITAGLCSPVVLGVSRALSRRAALLVHCLVVRRVVERAKVTWMPVMEALDLAVQAPSGFQPGTQGCNFIALYLPRAVFTFLPYSGQTPHLPSTSASRS